MSMISQRGATGPMALQSGGTFQSSTDANLAQLVGTRWDLSDGREVILVSAGSATTIASGKLYQDAAIVSGHQGLVVTAVQAYSSNGNIPATVTVTLGGTAATANQYAGGFAVIKSGTGLGQTLRIASHPAQATTTGSLVVTLEDAPNTALDTTSIVNLIPAHGANVIISPSTALTGSLAGIALYPIAASSYGFLVSKGIVAALSDSTTPAIGTAISASAATAGAIGVVSVGSTGTVVTSSVIGNAVQTGVSASYGAVSISL